MIVIIFSPYSSSYCNHCCPALDIYSILLYIQSMDNLSRCKVHQVSLDEIGEHMKLHYPMPTVKVFI